MGRRIVTAVIVLAVLAAGAAGFAALNAGKQKPAPKESTAAAPSVDVVRPDTKLAPVRVSAVGSVVPARSLSVVSRVGGEVLSRHPQLVPGGRVAAGDVLFQIDPEDYDLAVRMRRADVKQAQAGVSVEKAEKAVAEAEWARLSDTVQPTAEGRRLALREVQQESAQAVLQSARAALSAAKLDRERTTVAAPFHALVVDGSLEVGQIVNLGSPVATLVADDVFWVRVSVPVDRLPWLRIPGISCDGEGCGSRAHIRQQPGSSAAAREGRVLRLLGDLDPLGKMARLLVEVPAPLQTDEAHPLPLLLGARVDVELAGPTLDGVVGVPRMAVRDGGRVWLAENDRLVFRDVEVVWSAEKQHYVRGVGPQDRIVVSRLSVPVDGMRIAVADDGASVTLASKREVTE